MFQVVSKNMVSCFLTFCLFGFLSCEQKRTHYETQNLEVIHEVLPDSTKFYLNAQSTLDPGVFSRTARGVSLKGEAFFEVEKGDLFTVSTSYADVQTNYGNFNIYNRDGIMIIGSRTSVLNVIHESRKSALIVNPNEIVRINMDGTIESAKDQARAVGSWITGKTKLRLVKLKEVIAELERKFDVKIEPVRLDLERQTACDFQHEDLELALRTATGLLNLSYSLEGDQTIRLFEE